MLTESQRRRAALKLLRALSDTTARAVAASMQVHPEAFAAAFRGIDPDRLTLHDFANLCMRVTYG